jgi:virginiamycin B lyase
VGLVILVIALTSVSAYFFAQYNEASKNACSTPTPSPYISEYCVINKLSSPNAIAVDSNGNVWFVIQNEGELGVLYSNTTMRMFQVPNATKSGLQSWGIAVDNSRDLVWFTDFTNNAVWRFSILTKQFISYNITTSSSAGPQQLVLDSRGDVWFAEVYSNYIGEITTAGQEYNYRLPSQLTNVPYSGPVGLAIDNNGTLWFSDPIANSIGSYDIGDGTFQVYNMTGKVNSPVGIAVDSQGNIWTTEHGPSLIAEFNPITKSFRSITTHVPVYFHTSLPYFVYIDSKGNIWFNEHEGNAIGRFTPSNNSLVEYVIPTEIFSYQNISGALTMALSTSGTPWFAESFAGKIGTVNLQAPIILDFSFENYTNSRALSIAPNEKVTLDLNVSSSSSDQLVQLSLYLSTYNFSPPVLFPFSSDQKPTEPAFLYSFSRANGTGDFTSELSIENQYLVPGEYYLTLSELSTNVIISSVIQVNAT